MGKPMSRALDEEILGSSRRGVFLATALSQSELL